jgi:hypothetical protein
LRPASFGEIGRFCRIDGWQLSRMGPHEIWTRVLPDGTLARTQVSHDAAKTPSLLSIGTGAVSASLVSWR